MDFTILLVILQLIFMEGILSIDNAAVLGAMVVHLPDDRPIVWPTSMRKFGYRMHKLFGNQRTAALRVGLLGAYLGRGIMLFLANLVIQNPWLKLVGAIYLIKLACDNLGKPAEGESDEDAHVHHLEGSRFWNIVLTIEVTDLIFSLDNVVVAVSLSDKLWVVSARCCDRYLDDALRRRSVQLRGGTGTDLEIGRVSAGIQYRY